MAFTEISGEHLLSRNVNHIQTRTNEYPCRAPSKITGIFEILLQAAFSLRKCSQHLLLLLSDMASDTFQQWEGYILSSRCSLVQLLLYMFGEVSWKLGQAGSPTLETLTQQTLLRLWFLLANCWPVIFIWDLSVWNTVNNLPICVL